MLADFFGNLERFAADLYPYRVPIGAAILIAITAAAYYAYRRGLHLWAWERRVPVAIVGVPALIALGFVAWDLGSPLFINVTVDEEFPFAYTAQVPNDMTMADAEMVMSLAARMDRPPVEEPMPEMLGAASTFQGNFTPAAELTPGPSNTIKPPEIVPPPAPNLTPMPTAEPTATSVQLATPIPTAAPETPPAPTAEPAQPVKLREGAFRDADSFHKGSGQALIYDLGGPNLLLRLEDFKVTNGPELHVVLAGHPDPERHADLESAGYVDLGLLKGNIGNQNYEIPASVNLDDKRSVVIYCRPFRVVFSVATLADTTN